MKPVLSINHIQQLLSKIKAKGTGYQTNFFLEPEKTALWLKRDLLRFAEIGDSLFLLKKNDGFFNFFFITPGLDFLQHDLQRFYTGFPEEIFVADLIGKESEPRIRDVFKEAGFEHYISLVRMSRLAINAPASRKDADNIYYADSTQVDQIVSLFRKYFDPYCEQIPLYEELMSWVKEGGLVVYSQDQEKVQGFMIFEQKGQTAYLRYWFVHPEHREKKIGSALIQKFFSDCGNTKRQIFWVIETNENAIKRYEHFGFKREQLFDHVCINRSLKYEKQNN